METANDNEIKNGRHWELTSYEWNPRTGAARFGYTHRFTAERREVFHMQSTWLVNTNTNTQEVRRAA